MIIMEENQMLEAAAESGSKLPSTTPAYFVIMHQPQGDEKEERILVANQDASAVAAVVQSGPHESKANTFLSSECTSGGITVTLDNNNMWNEFCRCSTEMVLTKQGRRMFPYCRYWISGMDPYQKYILAMDITPLDTHKYKWNGKWWEPGGKAEPHVLGRAFIHPESPSTGQYWMHQPVSFYKLKLTNNIMDQEGHVILHSMHRYMPRLHVIPADKATEVIQLNGPDVHTFTFPQTEFFAVTAYQNLQITQLKIDCNPFAKGFREGTVIGRPHKEGKLNNLLQAKDLPDRKKLEPDDPESTKKPKETFSMSEQSDAETENESFSSKQELPKLSNSRTTVLENLLRKLNQLDSLGDKRKVVTPSVPVDVPKIKIKEEPEDNYDYNKTDSNIGVQVKQEESDDEVTDEYSHSDDDYPILERHFAQFSNKFHSDRKHSVRSQSGVAKAKLLKLDHGKMPVLYLESCSTNKNVPNSQEPVLAHKTLENIKQEECTKEESTKEECIKVPSRIRSIKIEEVNILDQKRPIKRKIYADYAVPINVRSTRGRKKASSTPAKSKAAVIPENDGVAPVPKRRGRPPKNKGAKVGRPPKKRPPIETPQVFPDFKPDLEDVDGVLFVAFSSKEALDVHTVAKPKADVPPAPPEPPPVHVELTEEQQKIVDLEKQLMVQIKSMRHRQVIHPSLQQVGLRLNIVDQSMSIDLRYLGVELPLPFITNDSRWDNCGLSSEGLPFVSRTGKTTDYTKIKGWRDKFSSNPSSKSEAASSETTLKNRSAFCSDELDEYLENEAKLMEDIRGTSQNEMVISTVSFQFPTKSASYVRTLDSVLKKQALQASSNSLNITKSPPLPVQKRKYTRRNPTAKMKLKAKTKEPPVAQEKPVKSPPPKKSKGQKKVKPTRTPYVKKEPVTPPPVDRPPVFEHEANVTPRVVCFGENSLLSKFHHTASQGRLLTPGNKLFAKVQTKLLELEESAICQGKPHTYVTEKRAEIALSALLTVEDLLKRKSFHKKKRKSSRKKKSKRKLRCKNELCRRRCICPRVNHGDQKPVHCPQETCMFGCNCANGKVCLENNELNVTSSRSGRNGEGDVNTSSKDKPGATTHGASPEKHTDSATAEDGKSQKELEKPCILQQRLPGEPNYEDVKASGIKSGASAVSSSKIWLSEVITISDSSDVDNDSEPICIPEKGEVIEHKKPNHRKKTRSGKVSASKFNHLHTPKHAVHMEHLNAEDLHDSSSISCARVRVYKRKATEEKAKKDHGPCLDSETLGKENNHKPNKYREQEKENAGDIEMSEKRHKKSDSGGPAKLLNIISDSSREQDPQKILNIVSQHVNNNEPHSFRVGSFNIELTSEKKDEYASKSSATSHVKISVAPDHKPDEVTARPPPVKERMESITEQVPLETRAENETKSHGGKGLPFYTKVIPAGKLVARLKDPTLEHSEFIQVNGKKFSRAKLMLGQMGALHPANRIAAYITHKLRPRLLSLAKAKEADAKKVDNSAGSECSTAAENLKVCTDEMKTTIALPQSETVLPPTPSDVNTPHVMGEAGSLKKESAESRSPEPCALGLQKIHTPSSPVVVSTPVSTTPASTISVVTVVTPSVVSTTPSLSCSVVSPTKNQATILPTPIGTTQLVTQDSSISVTATLSNASNTVTSPSGPSKCVPIPPPALIRAPFPPMAPSVTPPVYPGTNKTLAASLASSLVASANVPTIGLVSSPTGRPTVTLRTVTSPSVATPRATLTSGVDKRLGPRLLLIPVSNGSTPIRPVQSVQTSPKQKTVLQPIKGPNGVNLFRHPSGQIIQLLPLQQIQGGTNQQGQRIVIRSQGPGVSIQLPPKTKTDVATPTTVTAGSSSNSPTPVLQTLSIPKVSPVKSGFRVVQTSPSQVATLKIGTLPGASKEKSTSAPKVVAYANSASGVIASTGVPLQSGSLPTLKCSTPTVLSSSPQSSATKSKVILMTGKPTVFIDAKHLANFPFLKSPMIVPWRGQNIEWGSSKECKGSSSMETDKAAIVEKKSGPKEPDISAEQEVSTQSLEKTEVMRSTVSSQVAVNVHESEISDISNGTLLPNTSNQDSLSSLRKSCRGSPDKEAETPSKTISMNPAPKSELYPEDSVAESAQDHEYSVPKSAQDHEYSVAKSAQDHEYSLAKSVQDSKDPALESAQEAEYSAAESAHDPKNVVSQSDQDTANQANESNQSLENAFTDRNQNTLARNGCNYVDKNRGHVKSAYCTMQVPPVAESNQQKMKSELKEEQCREVNLVHDRTMNEQDENLTSDPGYNSSTQDGENNSQTEEESESDDAVDIETVEQHSETPNIARFKSKVHPVPTYSDKLAPRVKASRRKKNRSRVHGDDTGDEEPLTHRLNHNENERKRRHEMRGLFEGLKNALCLHNLPKVSKSYMLKKAKEEIEELTDAADSLIKQKTLISQKHSHLIKKVSNLSGKPKDVVLKKLEYLCAKQKALETESKKTDFEDATLTPPVKKPSPPFPPIGLENEPSSSKKPIILSRKHVPLSVGSQQPTVITTTNLQMASTDQLAEVKEANIGQVAGIAPTLVQSDVRPTQMPTGTASVLIQLPGAMQLKGLIGNGSVPITLPGNSSVPITLSALPNTITAPSPSSSSESEIDDLSMMPRIVNVTSLAEEASSDLGLELGLHTPVMTKASTNTEPCTPSAKVTLSSQAERELPSMEDLPSTSYPVDTAKEKHCVNITQSSYSSLPVNLPQTNNNFIETLLKREKASMNHSPFVTASGVLRNAELEMEMKRLSSAIAELEPNEISEAMAEHEDSDETLTSLLNEIALLNQQLNNDNSDVGSDFLGPVTPSQGSAGKSADVNSSPILFGRLKELNEAKEKNLSLSPLLLQLDEGEIQESAKHSEGPGIVLFEGVTSKIALTPVESNPVPVPDNIAFVQANNQLEEASGSDMFWRPMPKLAPLGLKSSNVPSDQKVLGNKSMPSLASALFRLGSTKPLD